MRVLRNTRLGCRDVISMLLSMRAANLAAVALEKRSLCACWSERYFAAYSVESRSQCDREACSERRHRGCAIRAAGFGRVAVRTQSEQNEAAEAGDLSMHDATDAGALWLRS